MVSEKDLVPKYQTVPNSQEMIREIDQALRTWQKTFLQLWEKSIHDSWIRYLKYWGWGVKRIEMLLQ